MYSLDTSLIDVKGIGEKISTKLSKKDIQTVLDLLLWLPLRYEDRSLRLKINQLDQDQLATFEAEITSLSNYYKGRRSIQSATAKDETGRVKLMWFNNKWVIDRLKKGRKYLISGKKNNRGVIIQPVIEDVKGENIHTDRLVPVYSALAELKQGSLRRELKHIIDNLAKNKDPITKTDPQIPDFISALKTIHFPEAEEEVIKARERLALEELLLLIKQSQQIKQQWQHKQSGYKITPDNQNLIPDSIPFNLTNAQLKSIGEILNDLDDRVPMNRLLIGDVGSGKTVVAGIASYHTIKNGFNVALIAPTQILAQQHFETIQKLFPDIDVELMTAKQSTVKTNKDASSTFLYVGTHAVINKLDKIKPGLVIFDEQHRFGVSQRSKTLKLTKEPHILTMSATPIPRSLMLTIFSHLQLSLIDQMPEGRIPSQTMLIPESKREDSYQWMGEILSKPDQTAIVVCPFISKSKTPEFAHIASAKERYEELKKYYQQHFPKLKIALLHGKLKVKEKEQISRDLFDHKIDLLVTTPVVEVGLDVPTASIIIIEAGERFGMASLHQLRGRVGRAGQESYCLVFTSQKSGQKNQRLKEFTQINDGLKLAEKDLSRRGAGDLFGTRQHGLDNLRFADWTNVSLITKARKIADQLDQQDTDWQPFLPKFNNDISPIAN